MVRLTADLLLSSPSYLNPLTQRELYLRGHNIPSIENLGVTRDQNESIDLSDNDLRHLANFPRLVRLKTLLCAHNRIHTIASGVVHQLPNLENLALPENRLTQLNDLSPLAGFKKLKVLSLLGNEVCRVDHYRDWVTWQCRALRVLDFEKIKMADRVRADELFGTMEHPTSLAESILGIESKTFEVDGDSGAQGQGQSGGVKGVGLGRITEEERKKIKIAIMNAGSMAEVQRLERMLNEGRIPDVL